jgi:heat shock protein HtpX
MKWMKGMVLLLVANILIMVTLSLTVPLLINIVLPMFGVDLRGAVDLSSLVWALAFGFGGAFISLAFSKQMARAMLDCYQITQPKSHAEQMIYGSVQERNGLRLRCLRFGSTKPQTPMPLRQGPARTTRWWLFRPGY